MNDLLKKIYEDVLMYENGVRFAIEFLSAFKRY